ncbi:MAG: SIR2 family protein, partial [Litorimonas sp.]
MGKYTGHDIRRIANAMRRQAKDEPERPFALMIGAGCSVSAGIPLAGDLVREIKANYADEIERMLGKECGDDYGACMSVLSASEVRAVLKPHLDGAGVNWGHLAIASLMKAGYVGRVLTFNFDSVLARACGMLGIYPTTYDFVTSVSTRTNFIQSPAILHLHGQGHGLAVLNSDEETREHAENLRPLLTDTLSKYPMIVAGYSGASDSVFKVMEDVFDGQQRLVWTDLKADCPAHVRRLLDTRKRSNEYLGEAKSDRFFMDLARELGCWPPKLFTNSSAHLLDEIEPIVDFPVEEEVGTDKDLLAQLKKKLRAESEKEEAEEPDIIELVMNNDWDGVISSIPEDTEDEQMREWLAIAFGSKGVRLADRIGERLDVAETNDMVRCFRKAAELNPSSHDALNNLGASLAELARATCPGRREKSMRRRSRSSRTNMRRSTTGESAWLTWRERPTTPTCSGRRERSMRTRSRSSRTPMRRSTTGESAWLTWRERPTTPIFSGKRERSLRRRSRLSRMTMRLSTIGGTACTSWRQRPTTPTCSGRRER